MSTGTLIGLFPIPRELASTRNNKVGDFTAEGQLILPELLVSLLVQNGNEVLEVAIPTSPAGDKLVWAGNSSGVIIVKATFEY